MFGNKKRDGIFSKAYKRNQLQAIKLKRNVETEKWGGILVLMYGILAICVKEFLIGLGLTIIGAGILAYGLLKKRKWDIIDSNVNHRGNTRIDVLCSKLNKSYDATCIIVQQMIDKEFFVGKDLDIVAYIDHEHRLLVMMCDGVPFVPIPDKMDPIANEEQQEAPSNLQLVKNAIDVVENEDLKQSLSEMENSMRRIEKYISKKPTLSDNRELIKLREYYIPKIVEIAEIYEERMSDSTKAKIKETIKNGERAVKNIEEQLLDVITTDTEVDIAQIKFSLTMEGLLGSDFDIK